MIVDILWQAEHHHLVSPVWVDSANAVLLTAPGSGEVLFFGLTTGEVHRAAVGGSPGFLFPVTDGRLLFGSGGELHLLAEDGTVVREEIIDTPATRIMAGAVDRQGRLWFGMTGSPTPSRSGLYRYHDARLVQMLFDCPSPGGIAFPACGARMVFADGTGQAIREYRLSKAGSLSRPQVLVDLAPEGRVPTALVVDRDAGLWGGFAGLPLIAAFDARGRLLREIALEVDEVTGLAFGGGESDVMLVTARKGGSALLLALRSLGAVGLPQPAIKLGHGDLGLVDDDEHPH